MISTEKNNNFKLIEQVDSSELSSDISEEENKNQIEKERFTPSNQTEERYNEEFNITKEIKKKRPRFFSENEENLFFNGKTKIGLFISLLLFPLKKEKLKIKTIDKKLKNFTEDELINSNIRKFVFSK